MEDRIYEIFGTFLNGELQKYFYSQERELTFYRCNESENRGDTCCNGLHGTVCITALNNIKDIHSKSVADCGNIKEEVRSNYSALITINLYSGLDEVMGIASKLGTALKLSRISDFFTFYGISVKRVKNIRRLDSIVKERYEYRANLDFEVNFCDEVVSDLVCRLNEFEIDLSICDMNSKINIQRDKADCLKTP